MNVQYFKIKDDQKRLLLLKLQQVGFNMKLMNFDAEDEIICVRPTDKTSASEVTIEHKFL